MKTKKIYMNGKTEKEIKDFIESIYNANTVSYIGISKDYVSFEVSKMYSYVDTSFETLTKLSEFFDTKKINLNNWHSAGCETCDYGSQYTVTFDIYKN